MVRGLIPKACGCVFMHLSPPQQNLLLLNSSGGLGLAALVESGPRPHRAHAIFSLVFPKCRTCKKKNLQSLYKPPPPDAVSIMGSVKLVDTLVDRLVSE